MSTSLASLGPTPDFSAISGPKQQVIFLTSVNGIVFDAGSFAESHVHESEATEDPIEDGSSICDNVIHKPMRLTMEMGVSDTPLYVQNPDPFVSGSNRRSQTAMQILDSLRLTAEPFNIQTMLMLYENMLLLRVTAKQDVDTAGVLFFEAEFREADIVSTQTVTYPPRAKGATARQAGSPVAKGEQQPTTVTAPAAQSSLLSKLSSVLSGPSAF